MDDALTNTVSRIANALTRTSTVGEKAPTISSGGALSAPLGMTMAPNGDLITVNGNNGKAVGINPAGKQLATRTRVGNGAGDLFGLTATATGTGLLFVNDGDNALDLDKA